MAEALGIPQETMPSHRPQLTVRIGIGRPRVSSVDRHDNECRLSATQAGGHVLAPANGGSTASAAAAGGASGRAVRDSSARGSGTGPCRPCGSRRPWRPVAAGARRRRSTGGTRGHQVWGSLSGRGWCDGPDLGGLRIGIVISSHVGWRGGCFRCGARTRGSNRGCRDSCFRRSVG